MNVIWYVAIGSVVFCVFCMTIYVARYGDRNPPKNAVAKFITHNGWGALLVFLMPMQLGEIARRETSVWPWKAFFNAYDRHGIEDGILTVMLVLIVELWALYLPAKLWVQHRPELDPTTARLARALNVAVGLLLLTPGNPIYWIVAHMPHGDPSD